MIGKLKPYSAYKDSGLPWLGEVPEHWELVPNRALLRKRKVLVGERHNDYQLLSLTKVGVIVRDISTGRGKFSADMGTSQEVRRGDLVFCLFDVPETPRTVGLAKHDGMITGAYTIFECCNSQLARFIEAFYIAMDDRKLLSPLYSGLRHTIPPSVFLGTKTPVPPIAEQAAIITFLNYADRRIRRYIRSKQKLTKLLEEQKQVVINQAVTRGLDPNVPLKPSGIEWLGDIPEHWEVQRLKHVTTPIEQGWSPQCYAWPASENEWGVLKVGCVNGDTFDPGQNKKLPPSLDPAPGLDIREGDILVSRANTKELVGLAAVAEKDYPKILLCDKTFRFRVISEKAIPQFVVYLIRDKVSRAQIESRTNGASDSMQNIGQGVIRNLVVALPPSPEQKQIVEFLSNQVSLIKISRLEAQKQISLLQEFRTRLIADVVTGKLDVREAAAHLPAELDEPEALEDDLPDPELDLDTDSDLEAIAEDEAA